MNRVEHLAWCKQRAHEYLARGDISNAVASMTSDMNTHPECKVNPVLAMVGVLAVANGSAADARRYIDGFK